MKPNKLLMILASAMVLLLGGQTSSPVQRADLQQKIAEMQRRGYGVRVMDNNMVEITVPMTGEKRLWSLNEASEGEIRKWAVARGVPILEIDPRMIDTNMFAGWYQPWGRLPISNLIGLPLVAGNVDHSGDAEVFGLSRIGSYFETLVYDIDANGEARQRYRYDSNPGLVLRLTDVDRDSLEEIVFNSGGELSVFEQIVPDGLPISLNFVHNQYRNNVSPGFTGTYFGLLDSDSITDCLYKGSECDSVDTNRCTTKVYVAEYNSRVNDFLRVWSTDFGLGGVGGVGGFAVDDFDGDGKREFAVAELITYRVFVVENTSDNSYSWTWQDSMPFTNSYYTVSGDVDHDGKPEFFIGATSNGSWTTMYESDSNNRYSPKFIIHLLSGGFFDMPTYLTTDVDGDGVLELVIMSGNDLYIFKSRHDNEYYLWYLKREDTKDAVQFYDFNHDRKQDFIISKLGFDSLGRGVHYADYYRASSLLTIPETQNVPDELTLKKNYPNPFNPSTNIEYSLRARENVKMEVFNVLGQRIATLLDGEKERGGHTITWNATGLPGGIYFCRLTTQTQVRTIKMVLMP